MGHSLFFDGFLGRRLHLGVTGSVAAYRMADLARELMRHNVAVSATLTEAACRFVAPLTFRALGVDPVGSGMFDPDPDVGPFAHLAPGRTAHALLVAPASADMLAKMAHGLADDLLSCQALAFSGPILAAPAMNPAMWAAAATRANVAVLRERGVEFIGPDTGGVACGDTGAGRLAPMDHILACALRALAPKDMAGLRVLVTLGPTREGFDAVRFWSNPSSGRMGACLAAAAWLRGADVTAVCGPGAPGLPPGVDRVDVTSARQMFEAVTGLWPGMNAAALVAAVADFRPVPWGAGKMPKTEVGEAGLTVRFEANPDILRALGQAKGPGQKLLGFAAQAGDDDLEARAREKLAAKRLDLMAANRIDRPGTGFGSPDNEMLVLDAQGLSERWPVLPKPEVAWRLWDHLLKL
ncbi:MAG: bifunctional phosphopantothenoylcysteine decarboxylase/phosphopantothenate--cysteine ligase CoaBC [Desulfovibrionaceae bacterium]